MITKKLSPLIKSLLVTVTYVIPTLLISLLPLSDTLLRLLFLPAYLLYTWFWVRVVDKQSWKVLQLNVNKKALKGFLFALVLTAIIVSFSLMIAIFFFHHRFRGPSAFTPSNLWFAFLSSFVVQGFPEEMVYRGYMLQTLQTKYSQITSLVLTTGLFALMHVTHLFTSGIINGLVIVFVAFSFALLAGFLKYFFKTTWAAVAVHGGLHMTRKLFELAGLETTTLTFFISGLIFLIVSLGLFLSFKNQLKESYQS